MRFDSYSFGIIRIDGVTYDHDVVIDRGSIAKRQKKKSKPFRSAYGHTPQPSGFIRRAGGVVVAATASPLSFFNEIISVEDHPGPEALAEAVQASGMPGWPRSHTYARVSITRWSR